MRILVDARLVGGTSTGDSTYWTCLLPELLNADPSVELILASDKPVPHVPGLERAERLLGRRQSRAFALWELPRLARETRADLVHTQYSVGPGFPVPVVSTIHDVSFLIRPDWFSAKDRILLKWGVRSAARRAARLLTVSESSKGEIERLVPGARGKVDAALNACPPWIRRLPHDEAWPIVQAMGVQEPFALTVGTRWARKNMELAISAFDGLPESLPHRLVVTGKGGADAPLGKRGRATGYVDANTLSALYSTAHVYLAPSLHEGFGIPLLEAFRCGAPVLTTGAGAMGEVAGDAAEIAPPADWPGAIERLLRDVERQDALRERGFEREREFTWAASAAATLASYRRAVQR